jgi:hypothetical protein
MRGGYYIRDVSNFLVDRPRGLIPIKPGPTTHREAETVTWQTSLDNLSKRVVTPLMKAAGREWHGWYSLRRGVSAVLTGVTGDALASKGLLRPTNLATTACQ